ncbi:MAG TPA: AbrB/MazE/SpoVT family DNA-binding domain-containing protein [Azospirillum sp.]
MGYIEVGPNGEIALPQDVRDRLGLKPGDRVRIDVDTAKHTAVLVPEADDAAAAGADEAHPRKRYTLDDLIGIGGTFHRPVSQEEMDEAIRRRAAERFLRR